MKRIQFHLWVVALLWLIPGQSVLGADAKSPAPDFKEVYDLIRANLPGVSESELNRAAVQGLLEALGPKVSLVSNGSRTVSPADGPLISKAGRFEDGIVYVRISRVGDGLANEVGNVLRDQTSTNKIKGVVLDLRFAGGDDYAAVVALADAFVAKARPLLDWGSGMKSAQDKTNAIQVPVAVLANRETVGAAEAVAAVLRVSGAGLILGSKTAGRALVAKSYPLKTGGELRIATSPVTLGDGSALTANGVKPDIEVAVSEEEERAYFADAYYVPLKPNLGVGVLNPSGGTNASRRVRYNEAELVREHREGQDRGGDGVLRLRRADDGAGRSSEQDTPQVNDPVLARALDLLKGLAVVRQPRS